MNITGDLPTETVFIKGSITGNRKATKQRLFQLLLLMLGVILGWFLCHFFPLIGHQSEITENLNQVNYV